MARLDRFYLNHHLSEQIDRELQSIALEWRPDLSDHRALLIARRLPSVMDASSRAISPSIYSHPDFPRRCHLAYEEKVKESADSSRLKQLSLLKEAMREVAIGFMGHEVGHSIATATSDKLGTVMKFLRAAEKESLSTISQCLMRYPHIAALVANPYELSGNLAVAHRSLRDHAVDLARTLALDQIRSAQEAAEELGQFEATKKRKKGSRLLHKLAPGKCGAIGAVIDSRGKFLTDPQEMANHLRQHWLEVFRAKGVSQDRLHAWLDEDATVRSQHGPVHDTVANLRLKRRAIRRALKMSNNSAPGPDGIPYGAWRALGDVAVEVLFGAFSDLILPEGPEMLRRDYPDFNSSLLFFLPKKPSGATAHGVPAFEAGGVRPLNVTNCDNRLLASAVRITLEPVLGPLITTDQRGFLSGRSMLANLLDVDEAMLNTAAHGERGMAFFFDFAAAFPSIEHDFFQQFFRRLGWPQWLVNIIGIFYQDNFCSICLAGARYVGFSISRGIRQGCPLSPLLFAMATDLMLRRLQRRFPTACSRAWADDLATVLPDADVHFRALQDFFLDFGRVAGLHLNICKTVLVPLFRFDETDVRALVSSGAPDWGGVRIASSAKYLGFYVGPGKGDSSWREPLQKFLDRARQWGKLGLGMLLSLQAYQVYISSVLQFVAQLEPLPINFRNIERSATQALLPGPTAWMLPTCLKDAAYFHFPVALVDLFAISLAAKVRVVRFDNVAQGGLLVHSRAARLQLRFSEGCTIGHMLWCQGWGKCSFFHHLADADNQFSSRLQAGQAMGANASRRENFQHQITPLFRTTGVGSATVHFRRRLDRWTTLRTLPGCRVTKVCRVLEVLGRRASPKVQAAYLRTFCDGWCTRRRFQGDAQCAFGCGAGFDGLEHYARCTVVGQLFASSCNLIGHRDDDALDSFLILRDLHEEVVTARGLALYALYRLYNGIRHGQFCPSEFRDAFKRFTLD